MAGTPFHCAIVWPLFIAKPNRFDFIGLSVGAIIPDFLEPVMAFIPAYYSHARVATHSLLGAVTIIFLLGFVVSVSIVPAILRFFKNRYSNPRFYTFAGSDILAQRGNKIVVAYSVLLGTISHVIIDVFYHSVNPLLYPFGNVAIPLADSIVIRLITHVVITLVFVYLAYKYWWKIKH